MLSCVIMLSKPPDKSGSCNRGLTWHTRLRTQTVEFLDILLLVNHPVIFQRVRRKRQYIISQNVIKNVNVGFREKIYCFYVCNPVEVFETFARIEEVANRIVVSFKIMMTFWGVRSNNYGFWSNKFWRKQIS